jgi:hypothetical protein
MIQYLQAIHQSFNPRQRAIIFLFVTILLGSLYLYGAHRQATKINTQFSAVDQSAYVSYAIKLAETDYTYSGGRNRMPVYPLLQSIHYRSDLSSEEFWQEGKTLNIALSVAVLVVIWAILSHFLTGTTTNLLMLTTAFTVFMFKAGYFQAEILFYFFFFLCFLLFIQMLRRPSWQLAVITGAVLGLTHLTKASIIPGMVAFGTVYVLQALWKTYRTPTPRSTKMRRLLHSGLYLGLLVVFFLATVFPYIHTSKRRYGHWFYNVNSTFYIWYDSMSQAQQGTRAAGDRVGWPDLPDEEIPSARKYFSEKSPGEIAYRVIDGLYNSLDIHCLRGSTGTGQATTSAYGYCKFVTLNMVFLVFAIVVSRPLVWDIVRRNWALFLFALFFFGGYMLLYSWYVPIARGQRFMLSLFLPFMFSMTLFIEKLAAYTPEARAFGRRFDWWRLFQNIWFMLLIWAISLLFLLDQAALIDGSR